MHIGARARGLQLPRAFKPRDGIFLHQLCAFQRDGLGLIVQVQQNIARLHLLARARAQFGHPTRRFGKDGNRSQRLAIANGADAVGDLAFAGGQGSDLCRRACSALAATPAAATLRRLRRALLLSPAKAKAVQHTRRKDRRGHQACGTQRQRQGDLLPERHRTSFRWHVGVA